MSPITILPTPLAHAAAANANPRNASTIGIFEIAGRLGIAHLSESRVVRTLAAYVATAGLPAPFPRERAGELSDAVHRDSRWPRVAVDAWFDGRLPDAARGRLDLAERATIDSNLSARAAYLFGDDVA